MTTEETIEEQEVQKPIKVWKKDVETIDECFSVWETRFGLFQSETLEGRSMLTSPTREACIEMTRWHLKCEQEGWPEGSVRIINNGTVGGKL